jgi:DNA/RNA-binding domain of Phe-tRNA-synthetase-like protein
VLGESREEARKPTRSALPEGREPTRKASGTCGPQHECNHFVHTTPVLCRPSGPPLRIAVHQDLKGIVRLGVLRLSISSSSGVDKDALWSEIEKLVQEIRDRYKGVTPGMIPGVEEARRLYRAVGLDPTKTRPSSEALLRRVTKGKDLYRIHPIVDMFNMASLANLLPVGLYDESKIVGADIIVRLGEAGWGFDGIRKDRVNVHGRLCICDDAGPFGSPTSDSLRTAIEGGPERCLAVFFQHATGDPSRMQRALDHAEALAAIHLGAAARERYVYEASDETVD